MIPSLLKLVAISAKKFGSGNAKHFMEVGIDASATIKMKIIMETEQIQY